MEFISTRDFKIHTNKYLNQKADVVITKYGKPVAMLTPINNNSVEDIYLKLSNIVNEAGISKKEILKSLEEIRKEVYV